MIKNVYLSIIKLSEPGIMEKMAIKRLGKPVGRQILPTLRG